MFEGPSASTMLSRPRKPAAMAHAVLHSGSGRRRDRAAAERAASAVCRWPGAWRMRTSRRLRAGAVASLRRGRAGLRGRHRPRNQNLVEAYYYYAQTSSPQARWALADLFRKAAAVRREDFQSALLASQSLRMLGATTRPASWDARASAGPSAPSS